MFSNFARLMSKYLGSSYAFVGAVLLVIVWAISGPLFNFDAGWQLFINTTTTIMTFLMVFLIQNTQNRDTTAVHLKLDEIIRADVNTHNELLKIEECSDEDLQNELKKYEDLAAKIKGHLEKSTGSPEV